MIYLELGGDAKVTETKKRLGLAIPVVLYEKILEQAKYQGKTLNSLCLEIFWEYFESREKSSVAERDWDRGGRKIETNEKQISIQRIDNRKFLKIEEEFVEISDYKVVSSADGNTELTVSIKGVSTVFDLSTSLEIPMNRNGEVRWWK